MEEGAPFGIDCDSPDGGRGPPVGGVAVDAEGGALLHRDRPRGLVAEVVQLRLAHEDGVGGGGAPLVLREALVLP